MTDQDAPPPIWRWANELLALPKVIAAPLRRPDQQTSFGKGKPVLVIPGMLSGDRSTALLRASLSQAGFHAYGWGQASNVQVSPESVAGVQGRLDSIAANEGGPVVLIGWSLGGMYARLLALRRPDIVSMVATLGTPFSGDRHANNAWRLYEKLNDHSVDNPPFQEDISLKPSMKTLAFWSPIDGIVSPQSARGEPDQSDFRVELPYRHFELGSSRRAISQILRTFDSALASSD